MHCLFVVNGVRGRIRGSARVVLRICPARPFSVRVALKALRAYNSNLIIDSTKTFAAFCTLVQSVDAGQRASIINGFWCALRIASPFML